MNLEWLRTAIEFVVPVFLFVFGWYALLCTQKLQDRYAAWWEQGWLKEITPGVIPRTIRSRANTLQIRIGALLCIILSVVLAYFYWFGHWMKAA